MGTAVWAFIQAIFVGTEAGGIYALAVNVARIAILSVVAKLTQPKLDLSDIARGKTLTIRDPIAPQTFIYGEDLVSGPIIFGNTAGDENKDLFLAVAYAGHECDSVLGYRIDDTDITLAQVSGAFDGDITGGKYNGVGRIDVRLGTSTQGVVTNLTATFPGLFTPAHRGRGWGYMVWEFNLIEGKEAAFKTQPVNLRVNVKGYKVYDPRLDDTNGGTGPHRLATPSTWEWSHNPALCLAHFLLDDRFGMDEEDDRIDWPLVIAAANINEGLVAIPTAATQERYTCNVTFSADQTRREVRDELVNSMLGRLVFSQGLWKMWAGAALTSDVALTEANLLGAVTLQGTTSSRERYNRVRGKFIDKNRDWVAATYPEARSAAFVAQDNGEIRSIPIDFMSTNDFFEAQRKASSTLKMSRNQRIVVFEGNMSVFRVQPGAVITLDIVEWGFAGEKFFVTEWKFTDTGINLTLVEEVDTVWDEPAEGAYTVRAFTGTLTFGETGVSPPTGLAVVSLFRGAAISWTSPVQSTFTHIEIWASDSNVRGNAELVGTSGGESFLDTGFDGDRLRYYWIRAVNVFGEVSDWLPDLTTSTFIAYPLIEERPLVSDPFIRQGASFWDLNGTTYEVGVGTDGTDAIEIVPGEFFYAAARRGPREWDVISPGTFTIEVRFRTALTGNDIGGWTGFAPRPRVLITDEDETNPVVYQSNLTVGEHLFDTGDTQDVWFDDVVVFEVVDTGVAPRFIQIGFQVLAQGFAPEFQVDFVQARLIGRKFQGANSSGLVPDPGSEAGKILDDAGNWVTNIAGETNTGSNVGTDGVGVFDGKVSLDLQYRHIAPGSTKVTTTLNGNDIDIDVVTANIDHDLLLNYVAAAHIRWDLTGAENLHVDRIPNLPTSIITTGTFVDGLIAVSNVTQHVASINHDLLLNFVASEHIRWDLTGAEDIHNDRIVAGSINHDALLNYAAADHRDWGADQGANNIHANNFGAGVNMVDTVLDRPHISDFAVEHQAVAAIASTTINYSSGQSVLLTMGATNITTFAVSAWPASGRLGQLEIEVAQGATPRTIDWGSTVQWLNNSPPDLSTANETYLIHLRTRLGGVGAGSVIGSYGFDAATQVGEVNTGSNVGTDGVGVFDGKVTLDLQFRNIAPGSSKVTVTLNGNDIDLDIVEANINHDALLNFVSQEHIRWDLTGAEDVHVDRIAVGAVTQHVASINHDALLNFVATEHIRWDLTGGEDIHADRLSSGANMAGSVLDSPEISDFSIEDQVVTGVASTSINYLSGQSVLLNLSAANITTLTITNWPATGRLGQMEFEVTQGATPRTIAWDTVIAGTVDWPLGTEPDLNTANGRFLVNIRSRDGKTSLIGTYTAALS